MNPKPEQDIAHIRQMMERSSRFISLSGLSGIFSGIYALMAFASAMMTFKQEGIDYPGSRFTGFSAELLFKLMIICLITLVAAIVTSIIFTTRKSKKNHVKVDAPLTYRLLNSFMTPLIAGGAFCLALLNNSKAVLIAPAMLIFYGLALINASRYTYTDVIYLGYSELILGLIALAVPGYGIVFWAAGFGILHIIYGIVMYRKYE